MVILGLLVFLLVAFGPSLFKLEMTPALEGLRILIAFVALTPVLGKLTDYLRDREK